MNYLLPYGGGFDSTTLALYISSKLKEDDNLIIAHVDYGQKASNNEERALLKLAEVLPQNVEYFCGNIDMSFSSATIMKNTQVGSDKSNLLELRNPLLATYLCSYVVTTFPEFKELSIMMAFHYEPKDTPFKDGFTNWFSSLSETLSITSGIPVTITAPFVNFQRHEIFTLGNSLTQNFLDIAYSCYEETKCIDKQNGCNHCRMEYLMQQEFDKIENLEEAIVKISGKIKPY